MLNALIHHWRAYLLEALGLMAFMLGAGAFGTLFLYPGSAVAQAMPSGLAARAGVGACMGVVTFAIVTTIGGKTGAHINPAVTWSFYRQGKIGGWDAVFYTTAQLIGACLAPVLLLAAIGKPFTHETIQYATSQPGPGGAALAFAAEFVISFVLMLVILGVSNSKRFAPALPTVVGAIIAMYITFESPLSGMSLNPARSFGSALTAGQWDGIWLYFIAPVLAMLLAVDVYGLLGTRRAVNSPHYPIEKEPAHG